MAMKAKHAFGMLEKIDEALSAGKIDAYDILFVKDENGKPYVGWIDKDGNKVIVDNSVEFDELLNQISAKADAKDVSALGAEIATKATTEEVNAKIETAVSDSVSAANAYTNKMIEAAMDEHLTNKYEMADVPVGTIIDYRESEIRVMCPVGTKWVHQTVGDGGDANSYYATFKTYVYDDNVVGYIEHLGSDADSEILTNFQTDEYGRRYQPTWLALAKYDEVSGAWTYYGEKSTANHYIGWDYRIDWYNADGVMIGSDCIRINLSNEDCHSTAEPYYVSEVRTDVVAMVEEKIAEVEAAYEIVEF